MDQDQQKILYVYSLYANETGLSYLQYTAALAIFFHLKNKGHFPKYKDSLLLYDYKDARRYVWEDKKFMADINIVRDEGFLNRSRVKTKDYRDINAHQCTEAGRKYVASHKFDQKSEFAQIKKDLTCKCGKLLHVRLDDDGPVLHCPSNCYELKINDFLHHVERNIKTSFQPTHI